MPPPIAYIAAKFQEKHNVRLDVFSKATMGRYSVATLQNFVVSPEKCARQPLKRSRKSSKGEPLISTSAPTLDDYIAFVGEASQEEAPAPKKQKPVEESEGLVEADPKRLKLEYEAADIIIGPNGTRITRSVMDKTESAAKFPKAVSILLMALFSRETLATHSLTGKESPGMYYKLCHILP